MARVVHVTSVLVEGDKTGQGMGGGRGTEHVNKAFVIPRVKPADRGRPSDDDGPQNSLVSGRTRPARGGHTEQETARSTGDLWTSSSPFMVARPPREGTCVS